MIIIVGAGLSGLLTGYLLKKKGVPFKILEARERIGGRINSIYKNNEAPIEMGATWLTDQHTSLINLLDELKIECFEQKMDSTIFYQLSSASPAQLVEIPKQAPSYRIAGGTSNIIQSLHSRLNDKEIILNQFVKQIQIKDNSVKITTDKTLEAKAIVLAIPPKLWAHNITFEPALPDDLIETAKKTQTWMEDSIKVGLTYEQPFWQQEQLSDTLFSNVGPITEFYDHSDHKNEKFALCGFMDSSLKNLSDNIRRERVVHQLISIFGPKAEAFIKYEECVWSKEQFTFKSSSDFLLPHQNNGNPIYNKTLFNNKLLISSTEASSAFPGYMEGAVNSAMTTVEKLTNTLSKI